MYGPWWAVFWRSQLIMICTIFTRVCIWFDIVFNRVKSWFHHSIKGYILCAWDFWEKCILTTFSYPWASMDRASVRRTYAVYYVQKSAAYAKITHQRRTADFWKFLSTAENGYRDVLSAEKTRPHLPDYVIYVPPSCWKLIYFVYWPR